VLEVIHVVRMFETRSFVLINLLQEERHRTIDRRWPQSSVAEGLASSVCRPKRCEPKEGAEPPKREASRQLFRSGGKSSDRLNSRPNYFIKLVALASTGTTFIQTSI